MISVLKRILDNVNKKIQTTKTAKRFGMANTFSSVQLDIYRKSKLNFLKSISHFLEANSIGFISIHILQFQTQF